MRASAGVGRSRRAGRGGDAERAGHQLGRPAEAIARFFLAGSDGLTMQHLSLPDEEAERVCLRALVSAVLAMA